MICRLQVGDHEGAKLHLLRIGEIRLLEIFE